jgi:hypothetical protein
VLKKEIKKITDDGRMATAYERQLKREREMKRDREKQEAASAVEEELRGGHFGRDLIKENVYHADNFAMFEMNRKLHLLLRNEERQRISEEKRAQYMQEFRDSATRILYRNEIMKEEKRQDEERNAEIRRK